MRPLEETTTEKPVSEAREELLAPRAADWLWKPWYAKLWWAGIAIYWTGKIASLWIEALDDQYSTSLAGFLNVAFFPPIATMFLGFGFAREWFAWSDWEFVEPTLDEMFPPRSVGGLRDSNSDALDPRSGMLHWRHFHPDS